MTAKQDHAVHLQVKLEFGHNASCRKKPTPEGFTHDWTVFVRGPDNKDISHFVDKVVFHLHESFHRPKRVLKEPPYRIEEHGYGSFNLPIDVYFKNKEEPKKVRIEYDLFLPAMGLPAIDNIRSEALKFLNPPEEFKKKVLKSGGVIVDSTNCTNGSPVMSNSTNINGNSNGHHLHNGKEMRKEMKEIKEEKPAVPSEAEKTKKHKTDKVVSGKPASKLQSISHKRPSNSSEEELHIVKKKKKKVDESIAPKPTGFIPIEPPLPAGIGEQETVLDNKDLKLKIKSLPAKVSKKSDKATDKLIEKIKEKKKDKLNSSSGGGGGGASVSKNSSKRRNSSSIKPKEKTSKSCQESKPKAAISTEERKIEKITFRRESGDSWSSSRSNSPQLFPSILGNSIGSKNNALGTLMAELSDHDDDDDDDEDVDISTPFQSDSVKQKPDAVTPANNNTLNKKDYSKSGKDKTKTKSKELLAKKSDTKNMVTLSGKKDIPKSPGKNNKMDPIRASVNKNSLKTKLKESKNGHQIPHVDLIQLHKQLSSMKDGNSLQKVVDILEQSGCFIITDTTLDFDLYKLDSATIKQIQQCINR